MRHEKAEILVRIAMDMQGVSGGLSLEDIRSGYTDKPLSRRTAERLRDSLERLFPALEQVNPGEIPKRWRLPGIGLSSLAMISTEELADLNTAVALLRRENLPTKAANAARAIAKLRVVQKRHVLARIDPDLETLTHAEGLAMRPGPKPRLEGGIVSELRRAILENMSTPEQRCIGGPEQKYINGACKKAPELGAFSLCIRLGRMIRRRIGTGTA